MKKIFFILFAIACAQVNAAQLEVSHGYLRATPPGVMMSSAFMMLKNNSAETIILTGAQSSLAKAVELHSHAMVNGMMSMQHVDALVIKSGEQKMLKPGGLNLMFIDLTQALGEGDEVAFSLHFENGDKQMLTLPVKSIVKHIH